MSIQFRKLRKSERRNTVYKYKAWFEDYGGDVCYGVTVVEAIGNLINIHGSKHGVSLSEVS